MHRLSPLVTGASSGIGAAFARALAEQGSDLVLVARREDRLTALASELRGKFGTNAEVVVLDLGAVSAVETMKGRIMDPRPVDTVINCAGMATHGPFVSADGSRSQGEIQVNIGAVVDIARAFLPAMIREGRGTVVNVASIFAYQPTPDMAVYSAAKAFVLNFTEALWYESRGTGVKVLVVSPGPTRTEFFDSMGGYEMPRRISQTPEQVVETTLRALKRRDTPPSVASGLLTRVSALLPRLVPRRVAIRIAALYT